MAHDGREDGDGGRGAIGQASCKLVAMVRPCQGNPSSPQEIWDYVMSQDARLPGTWDATPSGALDAVRHGDWALAAYLAAQCFKDAGKSGPQVLATPDERCSSTLWHELVTPIVLEVPRGQERLCVRFGGIEEWVPTDQIEDAAVSSRGEVFVRGRGRGWLVKDPDSGAERAEHLRAGTAVDLSQFQWRRPRLRRLELEDEERLQLRRLLLQPPGGTEEGRPRFLRGRQAPTTAVLGLCYHVVAYPFAGDVTKALLRPVARSWAPSQREAAERVVRWLGETLISQCAKAGQWLLVETLLKARVPCPDLAEEFQDVCGRCKAVRRQWLRDLSGAAGGSGYPSLLALAAWSSGPRSGPTESSSSALHKVMQALKGQGFPLDFRAPSPLIVTAAVTERWDVVRVLLEQPEDVYVCAGALLDSKATLRLPEPLRELAEARRVSEDATPAPPKSLVEYFQRRLAGEVVLLPKGFDLDGNTLIHKKEGSITEVMNLPLRLVDASAPTGNFEVAFTALSDEVAKEVRAAAANPACGVLPIDLNGQAAVLAEDDLARGSTYLAVACPRSYLERGLAGDMRFSVPRNRIPTPHIMRNVPVCVRVLSPCCHIPLKGAAVLAGRVPLGSTDLEGKLACELPPGRHTLTSPVGPSTEQVVNIEAGGSDPFPVDLVADGEVYLYLQENPPDSDLLMLCCNREEIPPEARPFHGHASLPGREPGQQRGAPARGGFAPAACVLPAPAKCFESLRDLVPKVGEADGREFERTDKSDWFQEFAEKCLLASMFAGDPPPLSIGKLIGPPPQPPPDPKAELFSTAATAGSFRADPSRLPAPGKRQPPWRPVSAPSSPARRRFSVSACGTIAGGRYFMLGPDPKPWAGPYRGQH